MAEQHSKSLINAPVLPYQAWLDHLGVLYPVTGVLYVGSGRGHSIERYKKQRVPLVIYVEADKERLVNISAAIKNIDGWSAHGELLAGKNEPSLFHRASNPNESGLLVPETLNPLWQNLKTVESQKRQAITIKSFFETQAGEAAAKDVNWVHIDCLPALSILQGAEDILGRWDVVIARAIVDESLVQAQQGASQSDLDAFMARHGFICAAVEPERHPAIGQVLYVRNWKNELQSELALRKQQTQELQTQIGQVVRERDEHSGLAEQQSREIAALRLERDAQAKKSAEFEELRRERDEQLKRLDELGQELDKQGDEARQRHKVFDEELIKAEAQIDLIKSLLFKEPGL